MFKAMEGLLILDANPKIARGGNASSAQARTEEETGQLQRKRTEQKFQPKNQHMSNRETNFSQKIPTHVKQGNEQEVLINEKH